MVKVSANRFVEERVNAVKREVEFCAWRLRNKASKSLEEIFKMASRVAKGEIKHQRINGKMVKVTLPQRRIWLKIAEQAAEAIKSLADNINEREIQTRLNNIEALLKELTKSTTEAKSPSTP